MEIYYVEFSNGRENYWFYAEGRKWPCSAGLVQKDLARGIAKLVRVH